MLSLDSIEVRLIVLASFDFNLTVFGDYQALDKEVLVLDLICMCTPCVIVLFLRYD